MLQERYQGLTYVCHPSPQSLLSTDAGRRRHIWLLLFAYVHDWLQVKELSATVPELKYSTRSDDRQATLLALCSVLHLITLSLTLPCGNAAGAFAAGVLLAETNYRTQVEADIRPFRGILLGLFFVTTGSSMDLGLLFQQWPIVFALTIGLIAVKVGIIGSMGPWFGLTK